MRSRFVPEELRAGSGSSGSTSSVSGSKSSTPTSTRSRRALTAVKARVNLRALAAVDMRTVAAREMMAFRDELVAALGGDTELSPQRRKLVDLAVRVSLYLDHLDAYLAEQKTLINRRSRSVVPVLLQRQTLADHMARLLDKLGLDRVPTKIDNLDRYVAEKYGAVQEQA